jgi:ribosomal protein S18 acetylase RimI-like enzyme
VRSTPTLARLLGRRLRTISLGLSEVDAIHPQRPHWYLATIGTDPAAQGQGLGAALLRSGLRRSDEQRLPTYLEASTERNVAYYERFGFDVTKEVRLPDGPTLWAMWRPPGAES